MTSFNWNNIFLNNYGTPAIELVAGEGVIVKDSKGNEYLILSERDVIAKDNH